MSLTPLPAPLPGRKRVSEPHGPRQHSAAPCPALSLGNWHVRVRQPFSPAHRTGSVWPRCAGVSPCREGCRKLSPPAAAARRAGHVLGPEQSRDRALQREQGSIPPPLPPPGPRDTAAFSTLPPPQGKQSAVGRRPWLYSSLQPRKGSTGGTGTPEGDPINPCDGCQTPATLQVLSRALKPAANLSPLI